jgi:hypothetical protein
MTFLPCPCRGGPEVCHAPAAQRWNVAVRACRGAGASRGGARRPRGHRLRQGLGRGVSTGAQQFESCTTTCQAGRAGVGDAGDLWGAMGAAVSATGNVLVGNLDLNRVDVFSRDGSFVRTFGGGVAGGAGLQTCTTGCSYGSSGGGAGALSAPWGRCVRPVGPCRRRRVRQRPGVGVHRVRRVRSHLRLGA